ncbi:MAG: sugar phosphate isomerase/epimerase, partial [Alphaproteobacteria bacterium]|nr:sugar phosphate isomerase/epimerase [Alphaproteobacteria bacterium]
SETHAALVRKYAPYIAHVHVNELDGSGPGAGDYDFRSLLRELREVNYGGWVSVEAFDSDADAREVAARAIHILKRAEPQAVASGAI